MELFIRANELAQISEEARRQLEKSIEERIRPNKTFIGNRIKYEMSDRLHPRRVF